MKNNSDAGLYLLLIVVAAISMVYYVAGVVALRQEFFRSSHYVYAPFELKDDGQSLERLRKEAKDAGLKDGDFLLAMNGVPYVGYNQAHRLFRQSKPGTIVAVTVRPNSGNLHDTQSSVHEARIRLAPRRGPEFSVIGYIAFLVPVLGVPLLGLVVGYWVVAARPRDLNAWLVLVLLAFPETAFGNLDWNFWPAPWYLILGMWNLFIGLASFPALVWFGFLFPERWRVDIRFPWVKYLVLVSALLVAMFSLVSFMAEYFFVSFMHFLLGAQGFVDKFGSWFQGISVLLFLAALFDKLRSASSADSRRRIRVLAIGSGLSLGPLLLIFSLLPLLGKDPHHGSWFSAMIPFVSLFPITLAYVLIVQRAMDIRILLRLGTRYLLARATILTLEVGVIGFIIVHFIFPLMQRREHPYWNLLLTSICVAAIFQIVVLRGSAGQRSQRWLDRRFFREAYNSEVILNELATQVRQLTERSALVDTVLQRISQVLHVSQIAILLRVDEAFHLQQAIGMDVSGSLSLQEASATIQHLVHSNQPATIYHDRPEGWFADAHSDEKTILRSMNTELLLAMPGRNHLMGVIALGPKKSEQPYTSTDLFTLQSVASQTGLTLEVAELAQTLADEASQRIRLNRELEIAREVQQRMFPQEIPNIAGLSLAGTCRPASECGGDYYDLIELEDGNLAFAVGDVSGKGISAALIMASLRASLHGLMLDDPGDLAKMMQKVNRLVYGASSSSRYATFFFAVYHPTTRELHYVNAGHNPPMVVKASGEVLRLEACGPVVGLLPSATYEAPSLILDPGDVLLGYTDGISEAMTVDDEEWGEERMLEAADAGSADTAPAIIEKIFHEADIFTTGAEQHDDMTVLILKLMP